jgi:hypothetical protein
LKEREAKELREAKEVEGCTFAPSSATKATRTQSEFYEAQQKFIKDKQLKQQLAKERQ